MNPDPPPLPPTPSTSSKSIPAKRAASEAALDETQDGGEGITCVCEYTHDDGFSISCDSCSLWYHGACVNVSSSNCPNEWLCPSCTGRTVNVQRANDIQRQVQKNLSRKRPPSPVRSRARASILNGNNGKRGRRTSKGGDEHVNVDELYVAIVKDEVQDGDARERLRSQAHSWRGLSALDPVLVDKEPPPASTAVGQLPGWPTEFAIKAQSNIPSERFIQPFRSTITPSSAYLADPLNAYAQHGMPRPFVHLIGPPLNLALDARVNGNNARFIRSGCHPNAVLRPIICPSAKEKAGQEDGTDISFGVFSLKDVKAGEEVVLGWEWDDGNTIHHLPALLKSPDLFPPERIDQIRSQLRVMLHSLGRTFTSCACGHAAPDCALALADAFVNGSLPIPTPHKPDLGPLVGKRRNFAARENGRMGAAEEVELPREDMLPPKMRKRSATMPSSSSAPMENEPSDEDLMPPPPPPKRATGRRVSPNQPNAKPTSSRKRMKTSMTMPSPEPYSPSTPFSHLSLVSPIAAPPAMGWPPPADETPVDEEMPASTSTASVGRAKKGKGRAKRKEKEKEKEKVDGEEESVLPDSPIMRRPSTKSRKRKRRASPEPQPEVEVEEPVTREGEEGGMEVDRPATTPEVQVDVEETPASPPPDVLAGEEAPASPASAPVSPQDRSEATPPVVETTDPTPPPQEEPIPPPPKPQSKPKRRVRIPQALRRVPASPEATPEPQSTVSGGRDESEQPSSALTSPPNERMEDVSAGLKMKEDVKEVVEAVAEVTKDEEMVEPPQEVEEIVRSRSSSVPFLPTPPDMDAMSPAWEVRESTPARQDAPPRDPTPAPRELTPPPKEPTPPPRDPTPPPPPKVKLSLKDFKLRKMREREEQEQARAAAPPEPEADVEMAAAPAAADVEMGDAVLKSPVLEGPSGDSAKDEGMSVDVKAEALDDLATREEDTTMETDTTAVDETSFSPASVSAAVPAKPAFYVPPPPVWSRPSSPVNVPTKVEVKAVEEKPAEKPKVVEEAKVEEKPEESKVDNAPEEQPKVDNKPDSSLNSFAFTFRPPDVSPPSAPAAIRTLASSPGASTSTSTSTVAHPHSNGFSPPAPSRSPTLTPHSPATATFGRPKDVSPLYGHAHSKASSPAWSKPASPIQSKPIAPAWAMRGKAASPSPAPTASLLARISSPPPSARDQPYSRSVSPAFSSSDSFSRARGRQALQAVQTNHRALATAVSSKDPPPHKDLPPHMSNANTTPLAHERRFGAGRAPSSTPAEEVEDGEVPSDSIHVSTSMSSSSLPPTPTPHTPHHESTMPMPRAPPTQPRAFQALRAGAPPPSGPRALRLGLGGLPRAPQAERVSDRGWGRNRGSGSWGGRG
ncbi:unnamed protein product [Peniophora sp. CBMAI 1063]|nr:unnamed protein product [Peniophora sp. CBMAI 1063]